jgi:hypothetical protein
VNGRNVVDYSQVAEYYENNPDNDPHLHKPWRRFYFVLNAANGSEYTFDSDLDGFGEYAPVYPFGTNSGNYYPPIVGADGLLNFSNAYEKNGQGRVMSWKMGTPYLAIDGGQGASDEPEALSAGGDLIYRSVCCDRVGDWFNILSPGNNGIIWHYIRPLTELAPGYDVMWWGIDPNGLPRYSGNYGTVNGIYHNHGDQNPIIPYQGRLYIHRSNAIIAFGPGQGPGKLSLLTINPVQDTLQTPSLEELKGRLEVEIHKIVDGNQLLRPGYYNDGQFSGTYAQLDNYFENPGDTLYTLTRAYPYLNPQLQEQTRGYLQLVFETYFDPVMYARTGWVDGAPREAMPLPPEVSASLKNFPKETGAGGSWSWQYPQYNFYAMWKYAQIFPDKASRVYDLAKSKLQVPVPVDDTYFNKNPWELNGYIAGYIGFVNLQSIAGKATTDGDLRNQVTNELNRLEQLRASSFSKDTYWTDQINYPLQRTLNISRNFMLLVPELGNYLNQNAYSKVQAAVDEYNFTGPYWFAARYNATLLEGVMQNLYDYSAMFQAKAYILKQSRAVMTMYLDAPAFKRGDLFYIQNLIAAIEAP